MNRIFVSLLLFVFCAISLFAPQAATAVTIDTVWVGNPGNANDTTGFGGVSYEYRIGTYEVTNSQYGEFLNAKAASDPLSLWQGGFSNSGITRSGVSGSFTYAVKANMGNKPVNYLSWYDAIRFANWLNNGQGTGDTETGAYTLLGGTQYPSNGTSITRNAGATWFLPSENEWYKAAYHQPSVQGGDADIYWLYPTKTNSAPYSDQPPGSDAPLQSNTANFFATDSLVNGYNDGYAVTGSTSTVSGTIYQTDVGAYTLSSSFYGTFDQGGNMWEFNEQPFSGGGGSFRGLRGGSWAEFGGSGANDLSASFRNSGTGYSGNVGFRVASAVPEPSTGVLAVIACGMMWWWRKRFK